MQEEFRAIKKQLKKLKNQCKTAGCESETDQPTSSLEKNVQRVDNAFHFVVCDCEPSPPQAFQCRRNIVAFSVRQSSNSKTAAKPKFDSERLELLIETDSSRQTWC